MSNENFTAIKELTEIHENLKVIAVALSSIRVIDPHELKKEVNNQTARIRQCTSNFSLSTLEEGELLEKIGDLAQTCLHMILLRKFCTP